MPPTAYAERWMRTPSSRLGLPMCPAMLNLTQRWSRSYSSLTRGAYKWGTPSRLKFNNMVWERTFRLDLISKKFKKFRFHHEIVTDGVSASLLYSREVPVEKCKHSKSSKGSDDATSIRRHESHGIVGSGPLEKVNSDNGQWGWCVSGIPPDKETLKVVWKDIGRF